MIRDNPKIFCGYSDVTALSSSIYKKTGLVTYYGPHFSTFGMLKGAEYTINAFQKCLTDRGPYSLDHSILWSDDSWYLDQDNRTFFINDGWEVIQEGKAYGTIIAANLCTLNLLQGTHFIPSLNNVILFVEEDSDINPYIFDRNLESILQQTECKIRGLIIGRFQRKSNITNEMLKLIIKDKISLNNIPIIANVDFGHTYPMFTVPIGDVGSVIAEKKGVGIEILVH